MLRKGFGALLLRLVGLAVAAGVLFALSYWITMVLAVRWFVDVALRFAGANAE